MTNKKPSRGRNATSIISLRLTADERATLEQACRGHSLSAYVRQRLFQNSNEHPTGELRLSPQARQQLLARILMRLGELGLASKLSELSDAARVGILDASPETERLLSDLLKELHELRRDLLKALGLRPGKDDGQ